MHFLASAFGFDFRGPRAEIIDNVLQCKLDKWTVAGAFAMSFIAHCAKKVHNLHILNKIILIVLLTKVVIF